MRDKTDRTTGDLLRSPTAQRQAAFKRRMLEQGYKRKTVWLHQGDWERGKSEALQGFPAIPPVGADKLSWLSGYIEGQAELEARNQ